MYYTLPTHAEIMPRIEALKESMGKNFIDYKIMQQDGRVDIVQVTTSLRPSLRMLEACDRIMNTHNIVFDHQTLDHYVLNFMY